MGRCRSCDDQATYMVLVWYYGRRRRRCQRPYPYYVCKEHCLTLSMLQICDRQKFKAVPLSEQQRRWASGGGGVKQ